MHLLPALYACEQGREKTTNVQWNLVRNSMKISSAVVPGSIIAGFTTLGLEALTFDLPTQFATDVLTGDTQ
jgi:hypothetical protein